MCGIAGFCNFEINYADNKYKWNEIIQKMSDGIINRGRDSYGQYLNRFVGLGHRRLMIRDLETGGQPIKKITNGNEYVIVYNGELYNTKQIKTGLIKEGYVFETKSDAEVVLCAFIHFGEAFVNMLNGIFAFAIWADNKKALYLFRDRVGIKPLFYTLKDNTLIFGSEPKALFRYPAVIPEIDDTGLCEIFGLGPMRTSGNGVFKNINELLPGHFARFTGDGFTEIKYWDLISTPHSDSYEDTLEKISFLIKDAIKIQMVSDVPICTFLSGGLDSSVVTAVISRKLKEEGKRLDTFSFDFSGNDKYFKSNSFQPERDRPYVDKVAELYGTNHTYLECGEADLADLLYEAVDAKDLPGMADVDSSLLYFCRLVGKSNKVALTGECADEIFGGYPWFHSREAFDAVTFPWSANLEIRKAFLSEDLLKRLDLDGYVHSKYEQSIKSVPWLDGENAEEQRRREIAYLNIKWFMQTLLDRMDRMSMYAGLEARVPFADHRIIEYLWNVPWEMKYKNNTVKHLLRESSKNLLPDELLYRKKSPYPKTYNPGYENLLKERLTEVLENKNSKIQSLINKDKVTAFIKTPSDYGKPWFGQLMAAPQMMAYLLQINYWLEKYRV